MPDAVFVWTVGDVVCLVVVVFGLAAVSLSVMRGKARP